MQWTEPPPGWEEPLHMLLLPHTHSSPSAALAPAAHPPPAGPSSAPPAAAMPLSADPWLSAAHSVYTTHTH